MTRRMVPEPPRAALWVLTVTCAALAAALIYTALQPLPSIPVTPTSRDVPLTTPGADATTQALVRKIAVQTADLPTVYAIVHAQATEATQREVATWAASPHHNPRLEN